MKTEYCEKEAVVVAALRSGSLHDELLVHVGGCPVCSEVLLVVESLREGALAQDEAQLPGADAIWRRAQRLAREKAVAKATLPIRIVRTCACALAILAVPWIVFEFPQLPAWVHGVGLKAVSSMDGNWRAALTGTTLLGISGSVLCIALSSWYMLREE